MKGSGLSGGERSDDGTENENFFNWLYRISDLGFGLWIIVSWATGSVEIFRKGCYFLLPRTILCNIAVHIYRKLPLKDRVAPNFRSKSALAIHPYIFCFFLTLFNISLLIWEVTSNQGYGEISMIATFFLTTLAIIALLIASRMRRG